MHEQTPAQRQAEFHAALAEHLRNHPHLPIVNVAYNYVGSWQLQVIGEDIPGLVAWARSLGVEQLSAMAITDRAWSAVRAYSRLGPCRVGVFTGVDGFPRDVTAVTLVELEHFTEHGTLPGAGGTHAR